MTPYEKIMLSGYVKRNDYRMIEKITGLLELLEYFGVARDVEIAYIPGPTEYVDVYVSGELRLNSEGTIVVKEVEQIEVEVEKEVYVSGELRLETENRIVVTEYVSGDLKLDDEDRVVITETKEVEVEVEKEIYVSGDLRLETEDRIVVTKYVSGELMLDDENRVVVTEIKEVKVEVEVSGETVYVDRPIYVSGDLSIDADGRPLVYVSGATVYLPEPPDPEAEKWNAFGTKQDIVYAGRVLKYESNSGLLNIGSLLGSILKQYGAEGIPNYYKQTPFDVKLFVQDNDAVLKYYIDKYDLKKESYDDTVYAIEDWIMFGQFEYSMPTLNTEVNDLIRQPPIPLLTLSLLEGDWTKQFTLQPRPKIPPSTKALLTLVNTGELADVYGSDDPITRIPVLRYSSDREDEQKEGRKDRPTLDSYDYWQFPFEALFSGYGDCEDGATLIAALAINAGVPAYRIRVAVGQMGAGAGDSNGVAHVWCIYLASDDKWRVIDWCNGEDVNEGYGQIAAKPILQKKLAKDNDTYGKVWFTFNNENTWLGAPY
jgi:hypothetical protein